MVGEGYYQTMAPRKAVDPIERAFPFGKGLPGGGAGRFDETGSSGWWWPEVGRTGQRIRDWQSAAGRHCFRDVVTGSAEVGGTQGGQITGVL